MQAWAVVWAWAVVQDNCRCLLNGSVAFEMQCVFASFQDYWSLVVGCWSVWQAWTGGSADRVS